jgi:hypothetical protein
MERLSIMAFRRTGLLLSVAGILGMNFLVVSPASATPSPDPSASTEYSASLKPDTASGVQPMANCDITSRFGNRGQYICGTSPAFVFADPPGNELAYVDLVIGTDYFIYSDSYVCQASGPCNISGWGRLQNGLASNHVPANQIGLFVYTDPLRILPPIIGVIAPDGSEYCNIFTFPPYNWSGWSTLYCP